MKTVRTSVVPRPFLKWVGGKGQILGPLLSAVDEALPFGRYHEPFLGGGALFFEMARLRRLGRSKTFLSDNNPNLIDTYLAVQNQVEKLMELLRGHGACHSKDYYYEVRASVPNSLVEKAARIIYLNKTCFNGLFRENSKGEFNVPMGRYKNPRICDEENLRACSEALQRVEITRRGFEIVLEHAKPGDLVYFDPPYVPLSKTSSFTRYEKNDFDEACQRRLAEVYRELGKKGVKALLSNSMAPLVCELYAPFRLQKVMAKRHVNSKPEGRGAITEALVRNY